ncbi:MAG: YchJ family protein [Pseudobdellovibrionaceae bacterium]
MKCPCGSLKNQAECCDPLITGEKAAESPEELMRSRYTAFAINKMDYIFETTDPQARMDFDHKANEEWASSSKFLKLEILRASQEGNKGMVEFKATYQTGDQDPKVHHEISKFRKQAGVWYFREGRAQS